MERVGVRASDIHARAPAHRLQPLEHFDRGGGVTRFVRRAVAYARLAFDRHWLTARGGAEKIVHVLCHSLTNRAPTKLTRTEGRTKIERWLAPVAQSISAKVQECARQGDANKARLGAVSTRKLRDREATSPSDP